MFVGIVLRFYSASSGLEVIVECFCPLLQCSEPAFNSVSKKASTHHQSIKKKESLTEKLIRSQSAKSF
jgi:hypothetical protein